MNGKKNILIAPLDWGLGHATRCIPIIHQLNNDFNLFIACSGNAAILLKKEFPELKHLSLPSYRITYPVRRSMTWHMILQLPSVYATIMQEKKAAQKWIAKYKIDLIISDNRFGIYSKLIPSVFITHQINIKTPHLNKWVNKLNQKAISKFTHCWIPDFENMPGLAGELSHPPLKNVNTKYIGPLTRFSFTQAEKKYDITAVLSGPEPQRTLLEDILFKQLFEFPELKVNIVRGIYSENENSEIKNIRVYDNLSSDELEKLLHESKHLICRSGYSGIMDLQQVHAKILLIPTPQQTEQEYLAKLHSENKKYFFQKQSEVDVKSFLENTAFPVESDFKNQKTNFTSIVNEIL